MIDWTKWRSELRAATVSAFDEIFTASHGHRLYAFCLQTDDGAMTVGPCANNEQAYADQMAKEVDGLSLPEAAYARWAPAEWRYEMFGDASFDPLCRDLADAVFSDDTDFEVHFAQLLDAMADALAHLRAERAAELEGVTLFVTISDSEDAEALENRSAAALNPPPLAEAFLQRSS